MTSFTPLTMYLRATPRSTFRSRPSWRSVSSKNELFQESRLVAALEDLSVESPASKTSPDRS